MHVQQFDAEMTYRSCAQVPHPYFDYVKDREPLLFRDPLPQPQKLAAVAYVNSNCDAANGRGAIMRRLIAAMANSSLPVHSYGQCDKNMQVGRSGGGWAGGWVGASSPRGAQQQQQQQRDVYAKERLFVVHGMYRVHSHLGPQV